MSYRPKLIMGAAAALLAVAAWQCAPSRAGELGPTQISSNVSSAVEVHSIAVSYGDLDLTTRAGLATLYRRIDVAAGYACGSRYLTGSRAVSAYWLACKARATQDAIHSLDLQSLSASARTQARPAHIINRSTAG